MTWFRLLYRLALVTWPRRFREQHGEDATRAAAERVAEETGVRRTGRAFRELFDLLRSAPSIRRDAAWVAVPSSVHIERKFMGARFLSDDLRQACRSLARTRGFLTVSMTTLSIAVALCVSVMAVVNAYLLRGLPYPESDRLYTLQYGQPGQPGVRGLEKLDWRSLDDVIEQPIAWDLDFFTLRGAPYPEAVQGTWVTPGFVEGFGLRAALGRSFVRADFDPGAPAVALISHRLWQTRFGGATDVVGKAFQAHVNDRPGDEQSFTIVGVLPQGMWHLNVFTEVMAPLRAPTHPYMVRLRAGASPDEAARRIESLVRGGAVVPEGWGGVSIVSAHGAYVEQIRALLIALSTATGLVMLIACANVAVLFTVRARQRQHELAVRKALGASSGRVLRALLSEAVVLGIGATLAGVALAQAIITTTAPLLERSLGRSVPGGIAALRIDGVTLMAAIATGLFVTAVCGAVQVWTSRRATPALALTGGQRGASAGREQRRSHAVLIVVEVAACLTLLVGASLMIETGLRILNVPMGLDPRDVTVARLSLDQRKYPDAASRSTFYDRVVDGMRAADRVRSLAFANSWPLQQAPFRDVGRDEPGAAFAARVGMTGVSGSYFETLSITLEGRTFTSADTPASERVAIVSRTLAARLWPGRSAIGERIRVAPREDAEPGTQAVSYAVVGVAADVRHTHTDTDLADLYVSLGQYATPAPFMYVRTAGAAPRMEQDLRALIARLDPDMALLTPRPLGDILDQQRAGSRLLASLLAVFAGVSTVLALVGIYGVIAYTVKQREREIAVRIAIGADRGVITRMFLRQGAVVLGTGLLIGVGGALALGRVLQTQLFGVRPAEPIAIAVATFLLGLCGLAAVSLPSRAAASTDPAAALKN